MGIRDKEKWNSERQINMPPKPIKLGSRGAWITVWSVRLQNPRFVVKPWCLPNFGTNKTLIFIISWNYVPRSEMTKSGVKGLSCSKNTASYHLGWLFSIVPSSTCSETRGTQPHAPIFQLPCPLASGWAGGERGQYSLLCSACGLDCGCGLPPPTHGCWLQSSCSSDGSFPLLPFRLRTAGLAPLLRVRVLHHPCGLL